MRLRVHIELPVEQAELLARYVDLVFKWNRISNLTGVETPHEFITRHLTDCLAVVPFIRGTRLADIGSGAGLPGLVIACVRPEFEIDLLEPRGKRARFLRQVQIDLGLANVHVSESRVEAWRPTLPPDTLVCRALTSLHDFVALTRKLQAEGTRLLAMKGQNPAAEIAALDASHLAIRAERLSVPGWDTRYLVILDVTGI